MNSFIFIGPPGSGKGTQSSFLSKKFNITLISTGDLLRNEIASNGKLSSLIKDFIDSGKFVPDELVLDLISNFLSSEIFFNKKDKFIFDGFPRNLDQAKILDKLFLEKKITISNVFHFIIDEELLLKRVTGRFFCENCKEIYNTYFNPPKIEGTCDCCGSKIFGKRSDDSEQVLFERLNLYRENSSKLISFYQNRIPIIDIDASQDFDTIFKQMSCFF